MELYLDDALVRIAPTADEIKEEFDGLLKQEEGALVLRRDGDSSLAVLWHEVLGLCVSRRQGAHVLGVTMDEALADDALGALLEFSAGSTPRLLDPKHYEAEAHCPLCAAMAEEEARSRAGMN